MCASSSTIRIRAALRRRESGRASASVLRLPAWSGVPGLAKFNAKPCSPIIFACHKEAAKTCFPKTNFTLSAVPNLQAEKLKRTVSILNQFDSPGPHWNTQREGAMFPDKAAQRSSASAQVPCFLDPKLSPFD